jgi:hypothetical protein
MSAFAIQAVRVAEGAATFQSRGFLPGLVSLAVGDLRPEGRGVRLSGWVSDGRPGRLRRRTDTDGRGRPAEGLDSEGRLELVSQAKPNALMERRHEQIGATG